MSNVSLAETHRSFCRLCSANCGVLIDVVGDTVLSVRGDPDHPLSRGYICGKGRSLGEAHHHSARLDGAFLGRGQERHGAPIDDVLGDLADRIRRIIDESGPDSVGIYMGTAGFFDAAGAHVVLRLIEAIGTPNFYSPFTIDSIAVPVVSELLSGYSFLMPKIDMNTKMAVFIGANPVVSHGHTWAFSDPVRNIRRLQEHGEVWVLDPRTTETARLASKHLQLRAGSDHALLAHTVRELLVEGADHDYLRRHADDVDRLRLAVEPFDLATTAKITGLDADAICGFVAAIRRAGRVALMSGTGLTMSRSPAVAEWLARAIEIVTGSADREGGVSYNPGFYDQRDRQHFEPRSASPGPGSKARPEVPSWLGRRACATWADEVEDGTLRAFIVIGGNPVTAFPEHARVVRALEALEVVAVADVIDADTARYATHLLPCAGQLERSDLSKIGTGSAVYGQYTPPVVRMGEGRRPQWQLFAELGRLIGHDVLPRGLAPHECTTDDVLEEACVNARVPLAELAAQPAGVLSEEAVFGWVLDRVLPNGRWQLAPQVLVDQLAQLRVSDSLVYVPRRPRNRVNSTLRHVGRGAEADLINLHPDDAAAIGATEHTPVWVTSAHGTITGTVAFDTGLRPGCVSIHHGSDEPNVTKLTSSTIDIDPLTGMVLQSGIPVVLTLAPPA